MQAYTGPILNGENVFSWKKEVTKYMKTIHEWRTFCNLPPNEIWRDLTVVRDAQDSAIALLGTTVSRSIYDLILTKQESAKGAWDALMSVFAKPNRMKASRINATLKDLRFKSTGHLEFIEAIEDLVNELAFYEGRTASDEELRDWLLSSLADSSDFNKWSWERRRETNGSWFDLRMEFISLQPQAPLPQPEAMHVAATTSPNCWDSIL